MRRLRPLAVLLLTLVIGLGGALVPDAGVMGKPPPKKAGKPKSHAPKRRVPKRATPKPRRPVARKVKPPVRRPPVAKHRGEQKTAKTTKTTRKKEEERDKRRERLRAIHRERTRSTHRFASFDKRTGAYHFNSRWWYSFVVHPATVSAAETAEINYDNVVPPANVTVTPPVIKRGEGLPISKAGAALAGVFDSMDVEHRWLAGQQVDWRTGEPTGEEGAPASNGGAFVAAVCARFKVPMPAPAPENFLAAAQHDWLLQEGKARGWVLLGEMEAQLLANQGWVVIAAWKSTAPPGKARVSGLTAIVRPDGRPATEVSQRGPRLIQAGARNHKAIALKDSFPEAAWKEGEVVYLAHRPR